MAEERLQKIIAKAGLASRREAEELITAGKVTVNGHVVTELGTKADPARDHIKVRGRLVPRPEQFRYILLNKPRGVITTAKDPEGRETVMDLLRGVKERVFPIGRLDFNTEGLLILTNDGDLANQVGHPSGGMVKVYHAKVKGTPSGAVLERLERGIPIEGRKTAPCEIVRLRTTSRRPDDGNTWVEVHLHEGRTNQIRKMFALVGFPVAKLKRVSIGPLADPTLEAGTWRDLTPDEVEMLRYGPRRRPKAQPRRVRRRGRPGRQK